MKTIKKNSLALLAVIFTLVGISKIDLVKASNAGVKVCPGDGKGCVLWGAIEKGDGSGFIEIGKEDESQDTPAEPGA